MTARKLQTVRGSGNVFRDFRKPDADVRQLKALLAAEIVRSLEARDIGVRRAEDLTGIAAADFSRIRNANLGRFTIDRLLTILGRLGGEIDVAVTVRRNSRERPHAAA